MDDDPWYSVRCIFRRRRQGSEDWIGPGMNAYEERITVWRATSFADAIEQAEADAQEYGETVGFEYVGLAQCYRMAEELDSGAEVFSLIRESRLSPSRYIDRFFDTGRERQSPNLIG